MNRRAMAGVGVALAGFALGVVAMLQWSNVLDVNPTASTTATVQPSAMAKPSATAPPSASSASANPSFPANPTPTATPFSKHTYLLDTPASPWVVVNKHLPLEPVDHVPPQLVSLDAVPGGASHSLIPEAADALTQLYLAASGQGAAFTVITAYRSFEYQQGLYNDYVASWGRTRAETFVARPGFSEHQTGRAVDIYDTRACQLDVCFADTAAGQFVAAHAHEYGFIIRYPEGKENITGYQFEPWHLRYVGVELATEMYTAGPYTMEEFFGLDAAPTYLE